MNALENKIPPPLVALITAVMMWAMARDTPAMTINNTLRLALAGVLVVVGILLARAGFRAFGRANTTINPIDIEAASALVTTAFTVTRAIRCISVSLRFYWAGPFIWPFHGLC